MQTWCGIDMDMLVKLTHTEWKYVTVISTSQKVLLSTELFTD